MGQRLAILMEQTEDGLSDGEIYRRYSIQYTQLHRWRRSIGQIRETGVGRRTLHRGRTPEFIDQETDLLRYVHGRREIRAIVTVRNLTDELLKIVQPSRHRPFAHMRRYVYRLWLEIGFQ